MGALVDIQNVSMSRGNNLLFQTLSFPVEPGEVIWIQGANGIGKTTLLRLIAGLSRPDAGDIIWRQNDRSCPASTVVAYQGHKDAFKPQLTARQELKLWSQLYDYKENLEQVFEQVSLTERQALNTQSLSAGQRRRLAIARLLISQRPLWVMDEPAAAMDRAGRELIYKLITAQAQRGGAVILASHEPAIDLGVTTKRLTLMAPALDKAS